jgi:hypothetical protein
MKHLYQSIASLDHKIYTYKGQVDDNEAEEAADFFAQGGCDLGLEEAYQGVASECPHEEHKVLVLEEYKGDRIYADGSLYKAA